MCPSSPLVQPSFIHCAMGKERSEKSLAIPLPESHIHRTDSELQLHEDMAVAEYRDRCMFNRLVSGIRHRQQLHYNVERHAQILNIPYQHQHQTAHNDPRNGCTIQRNTSQTTQTSRPPSIQDTERSLENIISTRCKPVASSVTNNTTTIDAAPFFTTQWANNTQVPKSNNDDWAIEGFDSPRSVPHIIQDEDDTEHSDHVFDIEL